MRESDYRWQIPSLCQRVSILHTLTWRMTGASGCVVTTVFLFTIRPRVLLKMRQMRLPGALFSAMIRYIVSTHIIKVDCLSALLKMAFSIMIRHQRRYFLPKNRASRSTNPISKLHKCTQIPRITCGWDLLIKVIVSSISTIKFLIPTTFWSKQWAINRC